jgi:hypothetical protein
MATADRLKSRRVHVGGALAVVLLAGVVFAVGRDDSAWRTSREERDAVAVTSSTRHQFTDLDGLAAASDIVVMGRAVAAEPGRAFGGVDAEGAASADAVRSHVLTIEVRAVLLSRDPGAHPPDGSVVLVEEESALLDRTPIVVDGARPTKVGDAGIWFLSASRDPEFPGFTVVNSQGRYLLRDPESDVDGRLRGGDRADAFVRRIEGLGLEGLAAEVAALAAVPPA